MSKAILVWIDLNATRTVSMKDAMVAIGASSKKYIILYVYYSYYSLIIFIVIMIAYYAMRKVVSDRAAIHNRMECPLCKIRRTKLCRTMLFQLVNSCYPSQLIVNVFQRPFVLLYPFCFRATVLERKS